MSECVFAFFSRRVVRNVILLLLSSFYKLLTKKFFDTIYIPNFGQQEDTAHFSEILKTELFKLPSHMIVLN